MEKDFRPVRGVQTVSNPRPLLDSVDDLHMVSVSDVGRETLSYEAEHRGIPLIGFSPERGRIEISFSPALAGSRIDLDRLRKLCDEAEARVAGRR